MQVSIHLRLKCARLALTLPSVANDLRKSLEESFPGAFEVVDLPFQEGNVIRLIKRSGAEHISLEKIVEIASAHSLVL